MVVYAPGTLTLNNVTLNVRGRGYRGGDAIGAAWGCASVPIPPPYNLAGPNQGPAALREKALPVYRRGMSWRVGRLAMRVVAA